MTPLKELFIVDPSVVDSPEASNATGGALSFNRMMSRLAGTPSLAPVFAERFLESWETTQTVGRGSIEARARVRDLLDPSTRRWPRTASGQLDMTQAPFRLLAVANRLDLMKPGKPNGEGRLVFGLFDPINRGTNQPFASPAEAQGETFTVIFEFNLPATKSASEWATLWHGLGSKPFGADFNRALIDVVDQFADGPNLSQARTNEFFLGSPWQLREFALGPSGLVPSTTKQSPDPSLNNSQELIDWVKANEAAILSKTHVVPDSLLGGRADQGFPCQSRFCVNTFNDTKWNLSGTSSNPSGISETVRAAFAGETCNGCHNSDTGSGGVLESFYHVAPTRPAGLDGTIRVSGFVQQQLPLRADVLRSLLPCKSSGCSATYEVVSRWGTGTESKVTITNNSAAPVSTWSVGWTFPTTESIGSFWNANAADGTAPDYTFKNAGWNGTLAPGASTSFGFITHAPDASNVPTSLVANCQ